jgi:YegS/Rv2252/BmrU family lipid kinase
MPADRTDTWLAIVNPASGGSRARTGWPAVERALRAAGVALDVVHTSSAHDGKDIARRAVHEGRRRLLAAGGDGSVNDVLNGIMDAGLAPDDVVTLAPVPLGTGNDWARSLGIRRDPRCIAAAIASSRTILHDVGVIDFPAVPDASRRRHWFINVAGAGFDAHVIGRLPRQVPSALAYLGGALRGLATYRSPAFRITTDQAVIEDRLLLAFVANAQYCGNRMHVAPTAQPDDGLFDVIAIREVGLGAVLMKLAKLYRGTILGDPVVRHWRAAAVCIDASPTVMVQADGQLLGMTPARFSIRRQAVRVVVGEAPRRG